MNVLKRISFNRALFGTFFLGLAALMGGLSGQILWLEILGGCLMAPAFLAFLNVAVFGAFLEKSPTVDPRDLLVVPNLPPLAWSHNCGWECEVWLANWERTVSVSFACLDTERRTAPNPAQIATFAGAFDRVPAIVAAALQTFADHTGEWPEIDEYLGEPLVEPTQIETLIALAGIRLAAVPSGPNGEVEVEFDFSCDWDPASGFIITAVGDRVIGVGRGDGRPGE